MKSLHFGDARAEYESLTRDVGVAPLSDRTQLEFTGEDRASFLHNLCTADIRRLQPGHGCEAFITNVQGKTIGHGYVFCQADSLIFDTVPGQAAKLLPHFEKYHIREKVAFRDCTAEWGELLVAGDQAADLLRRLTGTPPPDVRLGHAAIMVGDTLRDLPSDSQSESSTISATISLRRADICGPSTLLLSGDRAAINGIWAALVAAGARPCGHEALEMARIEAGTPFFGQDISDKNLPQELVRDALAISFTKGCYLGQETVARIDALGHVNQTLRSLRFGGPEVPAPGAELTADGKAVGHVTSAAFSPRLGSPLALGYVRRGHAAPGTILRSGLGAVSVVELPV